MRLLVLGGTKFLGRGIVDAALRNGDEVTTFTRGEHGEPPDGVEALHGDRIDPDMVRFWEVFGFVRWAIYNVMQAYAHCERGRRGVAFAAMGRNTSLVEYELLMTLAGRYS